MPQNNDLESTLKEDIADDVEIHDTKDPDAVFITTRSKMELTLREYKDGIRARIAWTNPVILFLTVLSVILVADFGQTFGLSPDVWTGVYMVVLLFSTLWLGKTLFKIYKNRDKARIEYVIEELESENIGQKSQES